MIDALLFLQQSAGTVAGSGGAPGANGGGLNAILIQMLPILMIFVVMYFLILRPQQQRAKAHQAMILALKKGDVVITSSGMIGKIVRLEDREMQIEIADNVRIRMLRSAVLELRAKNEPANDTNPAG